MSALMEQLAAADARLSKKEDMGADPIKRMFSSLIAQEVAAQVAAEVEKIIPRRELDALQQLCKSMQDRMNDMAAGAGNGSAEAKAMAAKYAELAKDFGVLKGRVDAMASQPKVVQQAPAQLPAPARPNGYSARVNRSSDGLITGLDLTPK